MGLIAQAFSRDRLDASFATGGYQVDIVERPGDWMPEDRLTGLRRDLRAIAAGTLSAGDLDYGVFGEGREHLKNSVITLVRRRKDGKPVAFNALALMSVNLRQSTVRVLHLGLVMVDPNERSKGLSWILYGLTCLLLFMRGGLRPIYVSNVTQVPAVVGMVSETFSEVSPAPDGREPRDFRKVLIAREIMASHRHVFGVGPDADFDERHFIIRNAYTGGSDNLKKTFDEAPKHRSAAFNDWCGEVLDYGRGDDVLQIGLIDLAAAQRYATRTVPRGSLVQIAALGAIIFARRALLPAIQWFDTKSDYGPVRAR
ncbi:hypothetical protein [Roseibium sp. M-1]